MASNFADVFAKRFRAATRRALIRVGRELVGIIRQSISTPVVNGVRSAPGEPPFKEFGDLWKSYKYKVDAGAATYEDLHVFSSSIISLYLEEGTKHMLPRPHFNPAIRNYQPKRKFKQYLAEELRNKKYTPLEFGEGEFDI